MSAVPVESQQTKRPFILFLPAIKSPIRIGIGKSGLSPVSSHSVPVFSCFVGTLDQQPTTMPVDIKIFLKKATTITLDVYFCKLGQISTKACYAILSSI